MSKIKKYIKYILFIILGVLLTNVLIFIGFNVNYKNIDLKGTLPEQISIEKAEATNTEGRVYGYVLNNQDNDLNGKYIQIIVYDSNGDAIEVKQLEITGLDDKKMFQAYFNEDNIKSYSIDIVE